MLGATRRTLLFFLAAFSASTGLAQKKPPQKKPAAQSIALPAQFVGCYELQVGRWLPFGFFGGDEESVTLPHRIQLLAMRGSEGFEQGNLLVRAMPARKGEKPARDSPSYWAITSADSIELTWFNGFNGVAVSLKKSGDEFRGWAHAHFDFPTFPRAQRVMARRIPCEEKSSTAPDP
ncbi:MAG TPA: hypothetical protein VJN93_15220 [Candidatus Acidoferrum sp.]|nr:hypothetical protein [Candidatus Acidoferrum sp.]